MNAIACYMLQKTIYLSQTRKGNRTMKTISIRLDDSIYDKLDSMLEAMGQTKQTFYETYTRTVINEGCIPFIIKAPSSTAKEKDNKIQAYERLEYLKKSSPIDIDAEKEREKAMNEKYGVID